VKDEFMLEAVIGLVDCVERVMEVNLAFDALDDIELGLFRVHGIPFAVV
jgi:hypothetical protein